MLWSTYYGGTNFEGGKGISSDVSGNCYVTGYTNSSTNFPLLNAVQPSYGGGNNDIALLKFNNAGVRQWATYYGGTTFDYGNAIVCDAVGNSYVTGYTNSTTFPTVSAIQPVKNVVADAFIMKLNSSSAVQWATYYGGDDEDKGRGITLDLSGANVYVTGTAMGSFPVTSGAFQVFPSDPYSTEDIFVAKLNSTTAAVQYATFCGGYDVDIAEDIAVDNAGNAFITGYTFSSVYPIFNPGGGAYIDSTIGSLSTHDVFIQKLKGAATASPW